MAEIIAIDSIRPAVTTLPDAVERAHALDTRRSWIVEAPAGSGKTGLLIQRYLKLLADDTVTSPEQILAITFTRKATAEMRERVLSQLQAATLIEEPANNFDRETRPLALAALERDRALGWSLVDQPGRLHIRTIDSVCSEIASSLPVLSGTGGRLAVVDEAEELYSLAAHRTFLQLGGQDAALNKALREILLHRDGDLANCERLLSSMLRLRDQWGKLVPLGSRELDDAYLDDQVLPKLERALEGAICCALTQVSKIFPEHLLRQLTLAAASMAHLAGHKGASSPIFICASKTLSPSERAEDLEHWRALIHLLLTKEKSWRKNVSPHIVRFELSKSEQANLKSLIAEFDGNEDLRLALCELDNLPPAKYPAEQWSIAKALFRILRHAMAELQIVFAERSECDYAEIALSAKMALEADDGPDDLEAAVGIKLQHILVDEMQDTASSQYELIKTLTAHFDGRSQTVFLVGDPKQSIYLFRQARVERFLDAMTTLRLGEVELGLLRLTANFRSQGGLIRDFNDDFGQIFPTPSPQQNSSEVHFVAASAMRPASSEALDRVWHTNLLPYQREPKDGPEEQAKSMARDVRGIVEGWQSRPNPNGVTVPWRIAILARARGHLTAIVAELKGSSTQKPIPYRAVDIDPLKERLEVQDLYALTRALLHPADRTAWLAVLRAPWCGLTLEDLHILTGADDPQYSDATVPALIVERGDLLSNDAIERLKRTWPVFMAASANRFRLPLAQLVERTWIGLGGDAYLETPELANARSYLSQLDALEEQQGTVNLGALEARLGRLYAAPSLDPSAVELITIHKAKGLEWDVVIVPSLERCSSSNRNELLSWVELDSNSRTEGADEAANFLLAPIAGRGEDSAQLNRWIANIKKSREASELKRLFYVACTRAREELHLFASPRLLKSGAVEKKSGTLLKAAWPAAEVNFAGALAKASAHSDIEGFPAPSGSEEPLLTLAALAEDAPSERPALLKRLPLSFDPAQRFADSVLTPHGKIDDFEGVHFERPEGSVAARAFGNAVHIFLEQLTHLVAAGGALINLRAGLPGWAPRVAAILRSEGLPPTMVERLTQRVLRALASTLSDPAGIWLLSPHAGSATEYAITAWSEQRSNLRVDRIFRAGGEPLHPGESCLWIVDYKTSSHGSEGLDDFLSGERAKYAPQLEAYSQVLSQPKSGTRLALYYPVLSKLIWWIP